MIKTRKRSQLLFDENITILFRLKLQVNELILIELILKLPIELILNLIPFHH